MEFPLKLEPVDGLAIPHFLQEIKLENFFREESSTGQKIFECRLCDYATNNKSNYKRHEQFKHKLHVPDPLNLHSYQCSSCDYTTNNKSNLNRHTTAVHKDIIIKEESCDVRSSDLQNMPCSSVSPSSPSMENSFGNLKSEVLSSTSYNNQKKFNCNLCTYCTNDKGNFNRHQKSKHKISMIKPISPDDYNQNSAFKTETDPMKAAVMLPKREVEESELVQESGLPVSICDLKSAMIEHVHNSTRSESNLDVKTCKFCPFSTKYRKVLRQHKRQEHLDLLKVYQCDQCTFTSHWEESLKLHKKFHGIMKDFPGVTCDYCDFIYKYHPSDEKGLRKCKQTLNEHMNDEHAEFKQKCDECDKTVWTNQQMKVHMMKHAHTSNDGTLGCDRCEYKCKSAHRLKFHIDTVHLGIKKHLCQWCPAAFATTSSLKKHILSHTGERNFKCQFCEKAFHSKGNLEKHIRTHTGEKPYTCEVCGKSFSDQSYFIKHKRLHETTPSGTQLKEFPCPTCSKGFTRRSYLDSHMATHVHEIDGRPAKYTNEFKMEAVIQAKIHGINKAATDMSINRNTLKNWLKLSVHPNICNLCGKAFPYEAQLKNHVRTHPTEDTVIEKVNIRYEASFKQEVANFALENSIPEAIKKYQLAHSTINSWVKRITNPQICQLCGKHFSNESTVRRHIEQVHKNTPEGAAELLRRSEEMKTSRPFSEFLAHHQLLPSEEELLELSREKERKREEKEEFALMAQEMIFRERDISSNEVRSHSDKEDDDQLNLNLFSPITSVSVIDEHGLGKDLSELVKSEPEEQLEEM